MARIPEDVIQNLRDSADIVEIVSREVALKRAGNSFKGCCPFHDEKTPSFHVYPESAHYHCFGCKEHGSAIDFLMKRFGMSFRESLEELSRLTQIPIPERPATPEEEEYARQRGETRGVLEFAARYYRKLLADHPAGQGAREYLADRGFTPEILETFGVGFSRDVYEGPSSLHGYAQSKGLGVAAMEAAGLVRVNQEGRRYDFFRGRVMFPIRDPRGRVIGFGARLMHGDGPKYVNSTDTALFKKSRELYGQDLARGPAHRAGRLLVVEGYTDVMHCHQAGFEGTVAGLGTALTTDNALNLKRFGVPAVLLYDGDEAGRRAAERACDLLLVAEVEASVAILPSGQDSADLVTREGPAALEAVLSGAQSLLEYRISRLAVRHELSTLGGGEAAAREILGVVLEIANPLRQDMALKLLSERIGVPELTVRRMWAELQQRPARPRRPAQQAGGAAGESSPGAAGGPPAVEVPPAIFRAESRFLEAALADPSSWERIEPDYPAHSFQHPELREIAGAVHTLRQGGESMTRDNLAGMLAESDKTIRALQLLQPKQDAVARAMQDLQHMLRKAQLAKAVRTQSLADVVRARSEAREASESTDES